MPGFTDVLLPLAALGVGAYTVKKVIQTPQITPLRGSMLSMPSIVQSGSNGTTPNAPVSASMMVGAQTSFSPNAPSSASTFLQWVTNMFYPSQLTTSAQGRQFITNEEGYRNDVYVDVAGNPTVGIGHKVVPSDGLTVGQTVSDAQIQTFFNHDLSIAENAVRTYVKVPISQGQFDALVDFTFNLGAWNLANSTLLRKLNAGDYSGASQEFNRWVYAGGRVNADLVARRQGETQMFVA